MIKKIFLVAVVLLFSSVTYADVIKTHAISLTDSIKYEKDFTHFDYVNPDAPKGGTFRRGMIGGYDSFNPFAIKGIAFKASGYMYDTLLESSSDESNTYYGLLAESIEYPKDYSYVIFNLRKEAKWHDGKPLTSEDVVFSFYKITEVSPFYKNYYKLVEKCEALGPYKVKFTFKKGEFSRELPLITGQLTIIPKHYWKNRDLSKSTLEKPLGSGPYKIGDYEVGKRVVFERVKDYWGKNVPVVKGQYNFDKIIFEYFRDQTVSFEAFKAGHFDLNSEASGKRWYRGYVGKFFDDGLIKKEEIVHKNPQGMQGIFLNTAVKPLDNILVRKALLYAYDYDWLNKNIYFSQNKRFNSFFSNSTLACPDVLDDKLKNIIRKEWKNIDEKLLNSKFSYPTSKGDGNNRANLMKAVELLKKAGYQLKSGKMVDKNGNPLSFELIISSKSLEGDLLSYKKSLERIGIDFNIKLIDSASYVEKVRNKDYMMIYTTVRQSNSPGNEQRGMWTTAAATEKGSRNYSSIKNQVVDNLVEKIVSSKTRQEIVDYTMSLDWVLKQGYYVIPVGYSDKWRISYWDKFDKPSISPVYALGFNSWWINKDKEAKINKSVNR